MSRALSTRAALIVAAVLALVALVFAGVGAGMAINAHNDASDIRSSRASTYERQQNAVDLANTVMTKLMTIRQDTVKDDVAAIEADIDGDFASQFGPRTDSYESIVQLNKIVAEGSVVASGLENETTDDKGKTQYNVVMAVDQQIRNQPGDAAQSDDTKAGDTKTDDTKASAATSTSKAPSTSPAPTDTKDPTQSGTDPQKHTYRVRVVVTPNDDGDLKVTGVNFIP